MNNSYNGSDKEPKNPIPCNKCKKMIFFNPDIVSSINLKPIPFDYDSSKPHSCVSRNWSPRIRCVCGDEIIFDDKIRGDNGNKIPHSVSGNIHNCPILLQKNKTKKVRFSILRTIISMVLNKRWKN